MCIIISQFHRLLLIHHFLCRTGGISKHLQLLHSFPDLLLTLLFLLGLNMAYQLRVLVILQLKALSLSGTIHLQLSFKFWSEKPILIDKVGVHNAHIDAAEDHNASHDNLYGNCDHVAPSGLEYSLVDADDLFFKFHFYNFIIIIDLI